MAAKYIANNQNISTSLATNFTTYTYTCWLKRTSATAALIMTKEGSASSKTFFTAQTFVTIEQSFSIGNAIWTSDATTPMSANGLYFIAITHTPGAGLVVPSVYINAISQGVDVSSPPVGTFRNPGSFYKLGNRNTLLAGFDGYLEDCRLYDRALTLREIDAMYNMRGRDGIVRNLQFRYMFDELPPGSTLDGTNVIDYGQFATTVTVQTSSNVVTYDTSPFALSRLRRIA